MVVKVAAAEWAEAGIRVNTIGPGVTDTPMLGGAPVDRGWLADGRGPHRVRCDRHRRSGGRGRRGVARIALGDGPGPRRRRRPRAPQPEPRSVGRLGPRPEPPPSSSRGGGPPRPSSPGRTRRRCGTPPRFQNDTIEASPSDSGVGGGMAVGRPDGRGLRPEARSRARPAASVRLRLTARDRPSSHAACSASSDTCQPAPSRAAFPELVDHVDERQDAAVGAVGLQSRSGFGRAPTAAP